MQGIPARDAAGNVNSVYASVINLVDVVLAQVVDSKCLRSPAARVESVELAGFGFVDQGKEIASHAVDIWLHDTHNCIGRDGGINRVATGAQDFRSRLSSKKLRRGHDPVFGYGHGAPLFRD